MPHIWASVWLRGSCLSAMPYAGLVCRTVHRAPLVCLYSVAGTKALGLCVCVCCTTTSFASLADGVSMDVHLRVLLRSSVSTKFGLAITCCFAVAICFVLVACFVLVMRTYFVLTALSRGYCPIPAAGICFRRYCL